MGLFGHRILTWLARNEWNSFTCCCANKQKTENERPFITQTLLSNCSGQRPFHSQPCWLVLGCLHSSRALTASASMMWYLQPTGVQESYKITVSRALLCVFLKKIPPRCHKDPFTSWAFAHSPENTRYTLFWQVPWLLLGSRMSSSDHLHVQWANYWKDHWLLI